MAALNGKDIVIQIVHYIRSIEGIEKDWQFAVIAVDPEGNVNSMTNGVSLFTLARFILDNEDPSCRVDERISMKGS